MKQLVVHHSCTHDFSIGFCYCFSRCTIHTLLLRSKHRSWNGCSTMPLALVLLVNSISPHHPLPAHSHSIGTNGILLLLLQYAAQANLQPRSSLPVELYICRPYRQRCIWAWVAGSTTCSAAASTIFRNMLVTGPPKWATNTAAMVNIYMLATSTPRQPINARPTRSLTALPCSDTQRYSSSGTGVYHCDAISRNNFQRIHGGRMGVLYYRHHRLGRSPGQRRG